MLTVNDFRDLLALITSPALEITGVQAMRVAQLQQKLATAIQEAQAPKKVPDGDSPRPAE